MQLLIVNIQHSAICVNTSTACTQMQSPFINSSVKTVLLQTLTSCLTSSSASPSASDRLTGTRHPKHFRTDQGQRCWEPHIWRDEIYRCSLFISMHISLVLLCTGNAKTNVRCSENLNGHLMASCVKLFVPKIIKI